MNEHLITQFKRYEYLYRCDCDNIDILQATINKWHNVANELYDTTLFQYNPIENYDRTEDTQIDREHENSTNGKNVQTPQNWTTTTTQTPQNWVSTSQQLPNEWKTNTRQGGYGEEGFADTSEVEQSGQYTVQNRQEGTYSTSETQNGTFQNISEETDKGTNGEKIHSRTHGNIGVTTTQAMIQEERDIIIDCLDWYIQKFSDCFNLSMEVFNYGRM